jgi:peroxiredoxin family protein
MDGIEADLFFTFFGLDAIRKDRYEQIKVATVATPGRTCRPGSAHCPASPPSSRR